MDICVPTGPIPLEDVAEMLREELRECHHFIKECFDKAKATDPYHDTIQHRLVTLAARLMQASAITAAALTRIEGNASRQEIVVTHTPAQLSREGEG